MRKTLSPLVLAILLYFPSKAQDSKGAATIRQYWFVLLVAGPHRSQDTVTAAHIQEAHLANIRRLYAAGKLKVAGPFGEGAGNWQGLFIFDCASKQEVEQLLQTDPAVQAGRLDYTIRPWYTMPTGSFVPGKPASN